MDLYEKILKEELKDTGLYNQRVPISGGLELTSKCNLNCVHCYEASDRNNISMSTEKILSLVDELVTEGVLSLYLTGGEAMLREDFSYIYEYIRKSGIIVGILSNGTTITDDKIQLFKKYPPMMIDISIYGASEETYYKVTGKKGIFNIFIDCLKKLKKNEIPFNLKTVVMKENLKDLDQMKHIAQYFDVPFKFFTNIRPMNNGNKNPINHMLTVDEAIKAEFSDKNLIDFYLNIENSKEHMTERKKVCNKYLCKIGQNGFFITHDGFLHGCVRERKHGYNLEKQRFSEGWHNYIEKNFIEPRAEKCFLCVECKDMLYCDYCPAQFELETGDPTKPPEEVCIMARKRKEITLKKRGEEYDI